MAPRRTIAIGDIQGCSAALDVLIGAIEPGPGDVLVTLGDVVNRGPDTRGVIERLIGLEARHGCLLVPILGNHDQMLLDARDGGRREASEWLRRGGRSTLESYGLCRVADLDQIPVEHITFLRGCRPYHETADIIFLHAQYDPEVPLEAQPGWLLRWESLRDRIPGPHRSGKVAVVGHTAQKSGEILDLGHIVCLDTCCYGGGWLTAMDLGSRRVWQASLAGGLRHRAEEDAR